MINKSDFSPVTLEDRDLFTTHYKKYPQEHSDNTFTNMVCWNHFAHYEFARVRGNILLSSTINGETKFRPPIGPRNPALLEEVMHLAVSEGDEAPLVLVDASTKAWIEAEYPELPLYPDRDYFEYVYRSVDLATLPGKNYLTIRRHLNNFRKKCSPVIGAIHPDDIPEIKQFLIKWCEWKHCESEPFLEHEKEAVLYAVDHFRDLGLSGTMIRVPENIGAIALHEPLNESTALVHFEKGLPDCEGIYKAINAETAALLTGRFEFINRESDMGVKGLREAKERYHPHHMVEVSYAKKSDLEAVL